MPSHADDSTVVCTRIFEHATSSGNTEVVLRIWQPAASNADGGFACRFEIVGLPEYVSNCAQGVDSMQALAIAFNGAHSVLKHYASTLTWLGLPYDDVAVTMLVMEDAGRRKRIQDILDEEEYSIAARLKMRELTKEDREQVLEARRKAQDDADR